MQWHAWSSQLPEEERYLYAEYADIDDDEEDYDWMDDDEYNDVEDADEFVWMSNFDEDEGDELSELFQLVEREDSERIEIEAAVLAALRTVALRHEALASSQAKARPVVFGLEQYEESFAPDVFADSELHLEPEYVFE